MGAQIHQQKAVALHVRFFDDPESSKYVNNAPEAYYHRAIEQMEQFYPDAHYYLFSDRPSAAQRIIPLPKHRFTLVNHNQGDAMAYADLWLMTQCQHFIIANSTFSWWGAWLANHKNKIVIAPGFEVKQGSAWWGFDGLLPEEWILC